MQPVQTVSNFGHIYRKALQAHLQNMGYSLGFVRRTRHEDIQTVASAINIRPEILEQIEAGKIDFRIKTFFALCDHYDIDYEPLVNNGEIFKFKFE